MGHPRIGAPAMARRDERRLKPLTSGSYHLPPLSWTLKLFRTIRAPPFCRRSVQVKLKPKDDTLYAVRRIVSERIAKTTGARQFLVEWEGARADGTAWRNSWEHASNLTDDLVAKYDATLERYSDKQVTVELAPVLEMVRRSLARMVLIAKTKARPLLHEMEVPALFWAHRTA